MERIGLEYTLLGVDVEQGGKLVATDVTEDQLLGLIGGKKARIIVTPIGGQGYVFGRGNQQLSPSVIREVGVENVIIVATENKLASLRFGSLLVDTGDEELDRMLSGYRRVITGYKDETVIRVSS